MESFRTLVALSTQHNLELHHVDVTTAFLNEATRGVYQTRGGTPGVQALKEHLRTQAVTSLLEHSSACSPGEDEL